MRPFLLIAAILALAAPPDVGQDEVDAHLESLRPQIEDPRRDVAERERLAIEMAATLGRAARSETSVERRRARWDEAAGLLERFDARNPGHPQARLFTLQASIDRWALARSWQEQAEASPTDEVARGRAVEAFDATIARLRSIAPGPTESNEANAQNVRFRLARAIADRALLDPEGSDPRRRSEVEALSLLDRPITDPAIRGYSQLLRADLFGRLGRFDRAEDALRSADRSSPPPDESASIEVRTRIKIGRKQFDEALRALEAAPIEGTFRDLLSIRVLLAERSALGPGPVRSEVESEVFRRVAALRKAGGDDARLGVLALARSIDQPETVRDPDDWGALAEGLLLLGRPEEAANLALRGADRAEALGQDDRASAFRYQAGAMFFQAGAFARSDAILGGLADDPRAGPIRAKAGMLRVLARGRRLAAGDREIPRSAFLAALETQVREFPDHPASAEARWLLGKARLEAGDRDQAEAQWTKIPVGGPRWLDSQLALADLAQADLDSRTGRGDPEDAERRMTEARRLLTRSLALARDDSERAALQLRRAQLELTTDLGRPGEALELCDRLIRTATHDARRDEARRLRVVALARSGRFLDAEREVRDKGGRDHPSEILAQVRWLDQAAMASEPDSTQRRYGPILRVLMARVVARKAELTTVERVEADLRRARALHFVGDLDAARGALSALPDDPADIDPGLLDDLADVADRLDAHDRAAETYRLLAKRSRPGTRPWFEARYGLADVELRAGKVREARQLIDGTAILHPDLGGADLRAKFERLRQRIDQDSSRSRP